MAVDKDILKLHLNQAQLNGMAFWLGFANGFLNEVMPKKVKLASREDERMYAAVEQVYQSVYGNSRDFTPQVAVQLKDELALNGVGATDDGVKYLWDGFIAAYQPDEEKTAEAAHERLAKALDLDTRYAVRDQKDELLRQLREAGGARVDGIFSTIIFHKSAKRPGFWQATVLDDTGMPLGDFTARSPEETIEKVIGAKGDVRHSVAVKKAAPEVKQARWLRQENYEDTSYEVFCSNCFKLNGKKEEEECPHCGAKMADVNPKSKKED